MCFVFTDMWWKWMSDAYSSWTAISPVSSVLGPVNKNVFLLRRTFCNMHTPPLERQRGLINLSIFLGRFNLYLPIDEFMLLPLTDMSLHVGTRVHFHNLQAHNIHQLQDAHRASIASDRKRKTHFRLATQRSDRARGSWSLHMWILTETIKHSVALI